MHQFVNLSASLTNVEECVELAVKHNLGIEVMAFAFPEVLDGEWRVTLERYRQLLRPINGALTLHGPFMDMVSGSPDPRINAVCVARYSHSIRIAAELGAGVIVFHANFIGTLHNIFYREGWHARNVDFWGPLAEYAQQHNVTIALENMWEFDPTIIGNLLQEVNHPHLRACLDVGHAHLFQDREFSFDDWLVVLEPWLIEIHTNNNNGIIDEHHGYDWAQGVLNYHDVLSKIRSLRHQPLITLEMDRVKDMADSLYYFNVEEPA